MLLPYFHQWKKILQISLLILIYFHQALKNNSTLKKGIKLDFKRTDILEESLQILTAKLDLINFPLWINADIIDGPGLNLISNKIVNADTFLSLANQYAPMATVSPGKNDILRKILFPKMLLFIQQKRSTFVLKYTTRVHNKRIWICIYFGSNECND